MKREITNGLFQRIASDGAYPLGTALGVIHLALGVTSVFAGYVFLMRKAWSRSLLVAMIAAAR